MWGCQCVLVTFGVAGRSAAPVPEGRISLPNPMPEKAIGFTQFGASSWKECTCTSAGVCLSASTAVQSDWMLGPCLSDAIRRSSSGLEAALGLSAEGLLPNLLVKVCLLPEQTRRA